MRKISLTILAFFGLLVVLAVSVPLAVIWLADMLLPVLTRWFNAAEVTPPVRAIFVLSMLLIPALLIGRALYRTGLGRPASLPMPLYVSKEAQRRAAYDRPKALFRLVDIGVLAYIDHGQPSAHRRNAVPGSATGLRPFVVLKTQPWWAYPVFALGLVNVNVQFELHNAKKTPVMAHTHRVTLRAGRITVTPGHALDLEALSAGARHGHWALRVSIDDTLIGIHPFPVRMPVTSELAGKLSADGELDESVQEAVEALPKLSLKALLSEGAQPKGPVR